MGRSVPPNNSKYIVGGCEGRGRQQMAYDGRHSLPYSNAQQLGGVTEPRVCLYCCQGCVKTVGGLAVKEAVLERFYSLLTAGLRAGGVL